MEPSSVFTQNVASNVSTTPIQKHDTTPNPSTSVARGSEEQVSLAKNSHDIGDIKVPKLMMEPLLSPIVTLEQYDLLVLNNRMLH